MPEEAVKDGQESKDSKKAEKARKKEEKKKLKEEKKAAKKKGQNSEAADEQETIGGKIVIALATIVIIIIWLGILALLIKLDVGSFGSTVVYPILKDVPYVNIILPEVKTEVAVEEELPYKTLTEAADYIAQLEKKLDKALKANKNDAATIEDLQSQVRKLRKYKDNEAQFEAQKQAYYEQVVFGDKALDISEYQKYYEGIEPDNAEILYKEVIRQLQYDDNVTEYVKTYTSMKPKDAAAIFGTMTDNLTLVKRILENMTAQQRGDILAAMSQDMAAKLTEMLEPAK